MPPYASAPTAAPPVEFSTTGLVHYLEPLDPNDLLTLICGILLLSLAAQILRDREMHGGPGRHEPPRDGAAPQTRTRPDSYPKCRNEPTHQVLLWGWLRLAVGVLQMALALTGAVALFTIGLRPLTWSLVAGAMAATVLSRWLYHTRWPNNQAE